MEQESPNLVSIIAVLFHNAPWTKCLFVWENCIFSLLIILGLIIFSYFASRKKSLIPGRLQNIAEVYVSGVDDFVCGVLGKKGRKYVPFIGTLFIYIISMNFMGLIPFMKSSTTSWSTTLALSLCVFVYVQYTALKENGLIGYIDHLMDKPRGILAYSVFIPLLMLVLHIITELVKPLSLSLRLRSNIMGDDLGMSIIAGMGLAWLPLLLMNTFLAIIACIVQALVFCLLSTVYFALVVKEEEQIVSNPA